MRGVYYLKHRNKYRVAFQHKGKRIYSKEYDTAQEAFIRYLKLLAYYNGVDIIEYRIIGEGNEENKD